MSKLSLLFLIQLNWTSLVGSGAKAKITQQPGTAVRTKNFEITDNTGGEMNELLQSETTILEENHLVWKVADFANLLCKNEDSMQNLGFKMGYGLNLPTDWRISLAIDCIDGHQKAIWMNLKLLRKPDTCDDVMVAFRVKIKNKDGEGFCYDSKLSQLTNMAGMASLVPDNVGKLINLATKLNMKKAEEDLFKFISRHATNYGKLASMMRDAIISDWMVVPVTDDKSEDNEESDSLKK